MDAGASLPESTASPLQEDVLLLQVPFGGRGNVGVGETMRPNLVRQI